MVLQSWYVPDSKVSAGTTTSEVVLLVRSIYFAYNQFIVLPSLIGPHLRLPHIHSYGATYFVKNVVAKTFYFWYHKHDNPT